jgi:hypothetical protein
MCAHCMVALFSVSGLKLMWNDYEGRTGKKLPAPFRLFDMYADPLEEHDLLPSLLTQANVHTCIYTYIHKLANKRRRKKSTYII